MQFRVFISISIICLTWLDLLEAQIDFNRDIKPILSENCYFCHGPDAKKRKAKLRLDNFDDATNQRKGVTAIVPKKPSDSELIRRIFSTNPDEFMPPPEAKLKITEEQKDRLKEWIASGAKYEKHWAFIKPTKPKQTTKGNQIDQFVANTLKGSQLSSSPPADPSTLIRRLTLDLTGLPPTPEEVDQFLSDPSPKAYEETVNRLLDSQAYGERMAWEWLDAARYADTNGYQGDNERTMWPWRDWVVNAFNNNLPFDKFTVWQLAGDLLPNATFDQKLATGFLRNHPINGEGGRIAEENRVDYVMDMTETAGTIWLGLTFNCCRCHDHKFDPLTQREYYQLSAYFNQTPVNGGGGNAQQAPTLTVPSKQQRAEITAASEEIKVVKELITKRQEEIKKEKPKDPSDKLWTVLTAEKTKAITQKLTLQPDLSILASGENPKNDTYTITAKYDHEQIASIRLETLLHPSMTGGGLARSDSGNFVLTGFEVSLQPLGAKKSTPLPIAQAEATFEQGSHKITTAFDGNPEIGWAVHEGRIVDREHEAVFRLKKPVKAGNGSTLTFILRHDSPHISHNLGRIRLSASEDPKATLRNTDNSTDEQIAKLIKKRTDLESRLNKIKGSGPKVMIMQDMSKVRSTYILDKGSYSSRGEEVSMGTPAALPQMSKSYPKNRLGLARWIVSKDNPLTARVTVNRFWQQLFSVGLVKTSEDFGTQGETPLQKELLDYLAVSFIENDWNVKELIRMIVTSDTYKQSSKATHIDKGESNYTLDPQNRMLSRGPRFRMPSWMLRDHALAASGLLIREIGGSPVNTYQPKGIWEEASFGKKKYQRDSGPKLYRRGIYTFWRRIIAPPAFFDNANRQTCNVKPFLTNTPMHALYLLNDVTFVEASRVLAETALKKYSANDLKCLEFIFMRILARSPEEQEVKILLTTLNTSRKAYKEEPESAKSFVSIGEHPTDQSLNPVEHAAWTATALALINLDEAVTKQ